MEFSKLSTRKLIVAAAALGAVAVALNPRLTAEELAHVAVDSGARLVLCDQDSRGVVEAAVSAAGSGARIVLAGAVGAPFDAAMAAQPARRD